MGRGVGAGRAPIAIPTGSASYLRIAACVPVSLMCLRRAARTIPSRRDEESHR